MFQTAEEKISYLAQYLPAVGLIEDKKQAAAVADVWINMLKLSPWESIDQAKFKEGMDHVSLISHVNSTVECALAVSRIIKKYHGIECDEQRLIVLGLLHDADKAVEYEYNEAGDLVKSETAQKLQHGVLTAMLAREAGFDLDMLHLIITHTSDSNTKTALREGILFGYVDLCDWDMTCKFAKP